MVLASESVQWEQFSFSSRASLCTARDDSGRLGRDASTESTAGFTGWHTPSSRRVCCCSGLYGFGQDEIEITEPVGGANGDEPFSSGSIASLDANEQFKSRSRCCPECLQREIKIKDSAGHEQTAIE